MKKEWRIKQLQRITTSYEAEILKTRPRNIRACENILRAHAREARKKSLERKGNHWRRKQRLRNLRFQMKQIISERHPDRIRRVRGEETEIIIIKTSRKNSDKHEDASETDEDAYETDEDSYKTDEEAHETDEDDFEDDDDEYTGNNDEYKDEYEDDKKEEHEDDANSQHPNNQTSSEISKRPNSPDTNKPVGKTKHDSYEKLGNDDIIELYAQRPLHEDNDNINSIIDALCFVEYVDAVSTGVMPVTLDIL